MLHKIFGGMKMSWLFVIVFAVLSGAFTALMALTVPSGWSLHQNAATLEAWDVFGVFIIVNCRKPLEAAAKTFVYFLISQPLVYLIQVPFSALGFGLFRYYPSWFIITLLTFPGAWLGWYIKKDNITGAVIFSFISCLQILLGIGYVRQCFYTFPKMLLAAVFCFASVPVMILGVFHNAKARNTAFIIAIAAVIICCILKYAASLNLTATVKIDTERYPIDTSWTVTVSDPENCSAKLNPSASKLDSSDDLYLIVTFKQIGTTTVYLTDGTLTYSTEVSYFKTENGGYGSQSNELVAVTD